jgi:hypothetical protein
MTSACKWGIPPFNQFWSFFFVIAVDDKTESANLIVKGHEVYVPHKVLSSYTHTGAAALHVKYFGNIQYQLHYDLWTNSG